MPPTRCGHPCLTERDVRIPPSRPPRVGGKGGVRGGGGMTERMGTTDAAGSARVLSRVGRAAAAGVTDHVDQHPTPAPPQPAAPQRMRPRR